MFEKKFDIQTPVRYNTDMNRTGVPFRELVVRLQTRCSRRSGRWNTTYSIQPDRMIFMTVKRILTVPVPHGMRERLSPGREDAGRSTACMQQPLLSLQSLYLYSAL